MCRKNHSCLSLRFSDLFVIQQNCRDKGVYLESAPSLYKSLKVLYYCPCAKPAHVGGGAPSSAGGRGQCLFVNTPNFLCTSHKFAQNRTLSATKSPFHLLFRQNLRFRSDYISVRVTFSHSGHNSGTLGMDKTSGHEQGF